MTLSFLLGKNTFSSKKQTKNKQELKELVSSRLVLQERLKEIIQADRRKILPDRNLYLHKRMKIIRFVNVSEKRFFPPKYQLFFYLTLPPLLSLC